MNLLYNAGIRLYGAAARLASMSSDKVTRMLRGQAETIGRIRSFRAAMAPDGFDVWFHAASLGEFEQGRPLIDILLAQRPGIRILLSFFSPSGYEVRCNFHQQVAVVYLPFDLPANVDAFLDAAAPRMAVFVKYEIWANYLSALRRREIPVYIISAIFRPGQIYFRPWGGFFRDILKNFTHLYVQDERSRALLAGVGITNVTVAGDTRFDRVTAIRKACRELPEIELFKAAGAPDSVTLVVGSSWERDEEVYIPWLQAHPQVRAIVAPHEFDERRLDVLRAQLGKDSTMLLSEFRAVFDRNREEAATVAARLRYLIVDCFGLLSSLYRFADIAYVGGGFGTGIHNINEAAVYGIPVVFGPRHQKFNEAAGLIECGGAYSVDSAQSLASVFDHLVSDTDARKASGRAADTYIRAHIGATPLIMKDIFNIIEN